MAQSWPSQLQSVLNRDSFSISIGDTVIRSDMEVGPQKFRRRFTKGVDVFSATIWLSRSEYTILYNFYNTTLNGGTLPFTFPHPITEVATDFRFKAPPKISPVGADTFQASFEWEALP